MARNDTTSSYAPSTLTTELPILAVAGDFVRELTKLRGKLARPDYSNDTITLTVVVGDKPRIELEYGEQYGGNHIKAASLGALMDEAYRRAGFTDREEGHLQAASRSLTALPAPIDDNNDAWPA
jgi:hypothetical protein